MDWLLFLIIAYFFIAVAFLVDKFILTKAVPQPVFYNLLISTLGLSALVLAPWGFSWLPNYYQTAKVALAGGTYTLALFFLYQSLKLGEASRVVTFVGGLGAVSTFIFSFLFLDQRLTLIQNVAFILLLAGGVLISLESRKSDRVSSWIWFGLSSALLFGASYTAAQSSYGSIGFVSGFVWLRIFAFLFALLLFIPPTYRHGIKQALVQRGGIRQGKIQLLIISAQILNGLAFIVLNYVISLANAAIVLAAQGLQYAYTLILTLIISVKFPKILKENYTPSILAQKIFAIILIAVGLVFLSVNSL